MENKFLQELSLVENKIRTALEENNFVQVSQLSVRFDEQVKELAHQLQIKDVVSQKDINLLKELTKKSN